MTQQSTKPYTQSKPESEYEPHINTVLLSGGAPNSPLMAGFLYALLEKDRMFSTYHTAGAGTLMALLCLAPKVDDTDPSGNGEDAVARFKRKGMRALQAWIDAGVSDDIYRFFPINFKLFHKPGPFAPMLNRLASRYKIDVDGNGESSADDPVKRLRGALLGKIFDTPDRRRVYNDLVELMFSAVTPSTLSPWSKGLAAHVPFLEDIVDFDRLRSDEVPVHLCVNAFNMATGVMDIFHRERIDAAHIRAAFSMPFIYPPAQIGTDYYSEGADHEPINFQPLYDEREEAWDREFGEEYQSDTAEIEAHEDVREDITEELQELYAEMETLRLESISEDAEHEHYYETRFKVIEEKRAALEASHAELGQQLEQLSDEVDELRKTSKIRRIVLLDVMGSLDQYLVRPPRNLWDSYVISIMTPVVALAKKQLQRFEAEQKVFFAEHGYQHFELIRVGFDIPSYAQPYVMDWSRSNLATLFDVGVKEGQKFLAVYEQKLPTIADVLAGKHAVPHDHHH